MNSTEMNLAKTQQSQHSTELSRAMKKAYGQPGTYVRAFVAWTLLLLIPASAQPPRKSDREKSRYQGGYAKKDFALLPSWPRARVVSVEVRPDVKVGFNLKVKVDGFDFNVASLGQREVTPEGRKRAFGYLHLYVNGKKRNRLYGPDFYLKEIDLEPGRNQLRLVLATHLHGNWTSQGQPIDYKFEVVRP